MSVEVKEARDGDVVRSGRVLIAPGNFHMEVEKRSLAPVVRITSADPVNGHRPSVDVLFESLARHYGDTVMAVIMTGMGKDGVKGIGKLCELGSVTISQDEQSCVVFGMPKAAIERGYIQHIVPLSEMASKINDLKEKN